MAKLLLAITLLLAGAFSLALPHSQLGHRSPSGLPYPPNEPSPPTNNDDDIDPTIIPILDSILDNQASPYPLNNSSLNNQTVSSPLNIPLPDNQTINAATSPLFNASLPENQNSSFLPVPPSGNFASENPTPPDGPLLILDDGADLDDQSSLLSPEPGTTVVINEDY
ncbi:hypothetical protein MMC28_010595 [Mycoblastus sanguinarius]|nr:hypothetical protein [Mycoblastus sanguinarius]